MLLNQDFQNLSHFQLTVNSIVEGFISGRHKSPFHGFSSEFSEHKHYVNGQSTKHIDWKLFARTDKLYVKQFEDETNLRCHFILDVSKSMFYPADQSINKQKIWFSAACISVLNKLLLSQRDAFGLSTFSNDLHFTSNLKNTPSHYRLLNYHLEKVLEKDITSVSSTNYSLNFEQIANLLPKRSVVIVFSDLLTNQTSDLLDAFKFFRFKKHKLIVFNTLDFATEINFDFKDTALKFDDLEYNINQNVYVDDVKATYKNKIQSDLSSIKELAYKYNFSFSTVDVNQGVEHFLKSYFIDKQMFSA